MSAELRAILAALPRESLAQLPSPVGVLPALSRALELPVYLKNDGLCSLDYAGNKVRKLEFLLAEARCQHATHIVTLGAAGSNHAVATSTYARQLGLSCTVCMTHQPPAPIVADNLRRHLYLGTQLEIFERYASAAARAAKLGNADNTYLIPLGGSAPVAVSGFLVAAAELAGQIEAGVIPAPDRVYVACGTMGTAVGLVLGFALLRLPIQVVAVRVTARAVASPTLFRQLYAHSIEYLESCGHRLNVDRHPGAAQLRFCEGYIGSGYGIPTAGATEALAAARADQLTLDTTYTGKAMAALIDHARTGELKEQKVLFWNTLNANTTALAPRPESTHLGPAFARYFTSV